MRYAGPLLLSVFLAVPAAAEVTVRVTPAAGAAAAHVELTARAAPLAEVLDRLGRQIGMKVVYEGASPRQLVTLSLQGRTPTETVLGLLEGQGLNFALVSDSTGTRVETLLVAGSAPQTVSSASASSPGRSTPSPSFRRPPPGSGPDTMETEAEEPEEEETFDDAPPNGAPAEGAGGAAGGAVPAAGQPDQPGPNPVPTPQAPGQRMEPSPSFPVSPFAPQASPYTPQPQPFPPLPPGVPGGPGGPPAAPTTPPQAEATGQPPPG